MLTISLMRSADYYLGSVGADYYLKGGEPPGEWFGGGAAELGLEGAIKADDFRAVFDGFDPRDKEKKLVANAGNPNRQAGWDHTFSAPKSVSILWALADESIRKVIEKCSTEAVKETLDHIEQTVSYSRTGKGGTKGRVSVGLTIGIFRHSTSRAGDPTLHHHCPIINVGIDARGHKRALVSRLLYQHKMLGGGFYRAALARNLEQHLSVRCKRRGICFELESVPRELIDLFSKRREEVLEEMAKKGVQGAKAAAAATLHSRKTKQTTPSLKELFERWREEAKNAGKFDRAIAKFNPSDTVGRTKRNSRRFLKKAMQQALSNLTRTRTHFDYLDLQREALYVGPEFGLGPQELLAATHELLNDDSRIVPLDTFVGQRFTTLDVLRAEARLLQLANDLFESRGARVSLKTLSAVQQEQTTPDQDGKCLNSEQQKAFLHLVESQSSIRFLHGLAGTGKTSFTLRACINAWQRDGYEVVGAAPTAKAAAVLADDSGVECRTIHSFLGEIPPKSLSEEFRESLKDVARDFIGDRNRKAPKPVKLNRKSIVVVDEAGMVNLEYFTKLMRRAKRAGSTIVFIGDPYQLSPVEGAAPFNSLSKRYGHAELKDIQRQEQAWARDASRHFYMGEPGKALRLFSKHNRLLIGDDKQGAIEKLVDKWSEHGVLSPEKTAIVCSTNADCDALNERCQRLLLEQGRLEGRKATIWDQREEGPQSAGVYEKDRVVFTKNWKAKGIQNGTLGTVVSVRGHNLRVQLDNEERVTIDVKEFKHIRLGYALTTYKSQGTTVDYAYLLAGGVMQDLPTSYVQATRAKKDSYIVATQDLLAGELNDVEGSGLAGQMRRRPDLSLASDFVTNAQYSGTDRAVVIGRLVNDYLTRSKHKSRNEGIVVPTLLHARAINQQCHERLAKDSSANVTTANGVSLAIGDKVVFKHSPYGYTDVTGRRATVANIAGENVTLEFDESLPLTKDRELIRQAAELNLEYAHALSVDQANQSLRDCPQPHILLDSPPDTQRDAFELYRSHKPIDELAEQHLDASSQEQKVAPRWQRDIIAEHGSWEAYEHHLAALQRRLKQEEEDREREEQWERQRIEKRQRVAKEVSVSDELQELVQASSVGLSQQVLQPTSYNPTPTPSFATPAAPGGFGSPEYTYQVVRGQAAQQEAQRRLDVIQQEQQRQAQQAQAISQRIDYQSQAQNY